MEPTFLTAKEAAARLSISERTIHREAQRGNITKHYLNSRVRYRTEDVDKLMAPETSPAAHLTA